MVCQNTWKNEQLSISKESVNKVEARIYTSNFFATNVTFIES